MFFMYHLYPLKNFCSPKLILFLNNFFNSEDFPQQQVFIQFYWFWNFSAIPIFLHHDLKNFRWLQIFYIMFPIYL